MKSKEIPYLHFMSISKDIEQLIEDHVIDQSTADRITTYYKSKEKDTSGRLLVIFGVLGALLVGLGIILILAHNWDQLPRVVKTVFAFIPLITGQILCWFTLKNKNESQTWRESSAVFLTLSIGASIALVSQIYHLEGSMKSFLFTWMILALPIIYLMRSSMTSLLYLIASAFFAGLAIDSRDIEFDFAFYVLLIAAIVPFYWYLIKNHWGSNALSFHHWLIPISIMYGIGIVAFSDDNYIILSYISLLGIFYMIGHGPFMKKLKIRNNGYLIIGALGTIGILLAYSFEFPWNHLRNQDISFTGRSAYSFGSSVVLMLLACVGLAYHLSKGTFDKITPVMPVFLIFLILYVLGLNYPGMSQLLINVLILAIAVLTIKSGVEQDHLGILNYGLLIITALLICRFFDSNLSFVLRGVLFILVGVAFFMTNNYLIKKRKADDQ